MTLDNLKNTFMLKKMNCSKLSKVFAELKEKNIKLLLDDSFCCIPPECANKKNLDNILDRTENFLGYIFTNGKNLEQIMEEIDGEGSTTIYWVFKAKKKKDRNKLGNIFIKILKKHGYIVEWNKRMASEITAVIEETNLPIDFLQRWREQHDFEDVFSNSDSSESHSINPLTKKLNEAIEKEACTRNLLHESNQEIKQLKSNWEKDRNELIASRAKILKLTMQIESLQCDLTNLRQINSQLINEKIINNDDTGKDPSEDEEEDPSEDEEEDLSEDEELSEDPSEDEEEDLSEDEEEDLSEDEEEDLSEDEELSEDPSEDEEEDPSEDEEEDLSEDEEEDPSEDEEEDLSEDEEEDLSEDEEEDPSEDEERVDPDENVIFTKEEEEQENLFQSDEEESDDEDDDEIIQDGLIIDPSSDESDLESDQDITICPDDCKCINCEAEREES
jgi:hypothetical protein